MSFDSYCTHNEIVANVDAIYCEWNEWESGVCSKECGGGIRTQVRTKKVEEAHGGTCEGERLLREPCNQHECPSKLSNFPYDYLLYLIVSTRRVLCIDNLSTTLTVNGRWGIFGDWGECPVTCGGSSHSRFRECNNPAPQHGGDDCTVDGSTYFETKACNENICPPG